MQKSAVVFGGSGFIGQHLCQELVREGYAITNADLIEHKNSAVQYVKCDVRKPIDITVKEVPDLVVNLAAVHRTPGHEIDEYYVTNVTGAINIANWCELIGANTVIFTSSIAVYGPSAENKIEDSIKIPVHAYGQSKLMAEEIFKMWQSHQKNNRSLIISRPAVIFGPGENGNFTRLARALKNNYFFFPGETSTIKSCGYVTDLVKACIFVHRQHKSGITIFNFCFPENYTIEEICKSFQKLANYRLPRTLPIKQFGKFLSKLPSPINTLGHRISKLVNPTIIEPKVLNQLGFAWEFNLDSALLNWKESSRSPRHFA
jgi:nucleoside-diphosphate-sugar epimerase